MRKICYHWLELDSNDILAKLIADGTLICNNTGICDRKSPIQKEVVRYKNIGCDGFGNSECPDPSAMIEGDNVVSR